MKLSNTFAYEFSQPVQSRGNSYYERRRITRYQGDIHHCHANVSGSSEYLVQIEYDVKENSLEYDCDCPYNGPCKHLWATLLLADEEGFLSLVDQDTYLAASYGDFSFRQPRELNLASPKADEASVLFPRDYYPHSQEEQMFVAQLEGLGLDKAVLANHFVAIIRRFPGGGIERYSREIFSINNLSFEDTDYDPAVERFLGQMQHINSHAGFHNVSETFSPEEEVVWQLVIGETSVLFELRLRALVRKRKKNGDWGKARTNAKQMFICATSVDRALFDHLDARREAAALYGDGWLISDSRLNQILPLLIETKRFTVRHEVMDGYWETPLQRVALQGGRYCHHVVQEISAYAVRQVIETAQEIIDFEDLDFITSRGYAHAGVWYGVNLSEYKSYLEYYSLDSVPLFDGKSLQAFIQRYRQDPAAPRLILPKDLDAPNANTDQQDPVKQLVFKQLTVKNGTVSSSEAQIQFGYGHVNFSVWDQEPGKATPDGGYIARDLPFETSALAELRSGGIEYQQSSLSLVISSKKLFDCVSYLSALGWLISVDGKLVRRQSATKLSVKSGIDWFDLRGDIAFGEQQLMLGEMLNQLDGSVVSLNDGSLGVFSDDNFDRLKKLMHLGKKTADGYKFKKSQALLLESLLADREDVVFDAEFKLAREALADFDGISPEAPPSSFNGELRVYQQEGLAWLTFCRRFNLGGCLADDMGLGKTVQVLAMLEQRRLDEQVTKPSLIVVPTSLVFNWLSEAAKFTPQIRILDHSHGARSKLVETFADYHVVVTTYGALRNDISFVKDMTFDYAILDEAQAIKNAGTSNAKAARLIEADHRLIMTGTPIENHLGELWSLFELLNPGMLGSAAAFKRFNTKIESQDELAALSQAIRSMMLGRRKENVAADLPDKVEQTLFYEMGTAQKQLYEKLRQDYQKRLLAGSGDANNKLQVLAALVKLRQAACHPGLIDEQHFDFDADSKLTLVLPQLLELIDEGRKVLVFSQFTRFLGLLKSGLDQAGARYEYLDGKTSNRQARVEHFQSDPDCQLFLISLKAGGTGLNLTAAEYIFLLDPWWNPAVEAQAIGRAHRIGQNNQVFAYRVIAKDTVEEKILQMQAKKQSLADAIINQDAGGLQNLSREDLETLFS